MLLGLLMVLYPFIGTGQETKLSVVSITQCKDSVSIPVILENGTDISAISLTIKYDSFSIQWFYTLNASVSLKKGLTMLNGLNGEIRFSWVSTHSIDLVNDTLFERNNLLPNTSYYWRCRALNDTCIERCFCSQRFIFLVSNNYNRGYTV
jgi:hypothetical protein